MNRFAMALAAALIVSGAAHADPIRVSTAGKSDVEVKAQVVGVATQLCRGENAGSLLDLHLQAICVRETVRSALAKSQSPELAQLSDARLPQAGAR